MERRDLHWNKFLCPKLVFVDAHRKFYWNYSFWVIGDNLCWLHFSLLKLSNRTISKGYICCSTGMVSYSFWAASNNRHLLYLLYIQYFYSNCVQTWQGNAILPQRVYLWVMIDTVQQIRARAIGAANTRGQVTQHVGIWCNVVIIAQPWGAVSSGLCSQSLPSPPEVAV